MQSFLIIGRNSKEVETEIDNLVKKYSLKKLDFEGQKIEQIRNLNSFVSLSLQEKTAIVVKSIDTSTHQAMNAFLKNLEEPQENLFFILSAKTIHKVLPTISSRCQIIFLSKKREIIDPQIYENLIKKNTVQKLAFLDKIKQRNEAVDFFINLVSFVHNKIKNNDGNYEFLAYIFHEAEKTLNKLEKNGNVNLQLTNFAVNTANFDTFT